jgi:hypothetical protein
MTTLLPQLAVFLLLVSSPLVYGSCSQINETYVCKLPIEIDISEMPNEYILLTENISCEGIGEIELQIFNKGEGQIYEVYAFAYRGNTCVSCVKERDENIIEISVGKMETKIVEIPIEVKSIGTYDFKVRVKKQNLKTWTELKGTIDIVEGGNKFDEESVFEETEIKSNIPIVESKNFSYNSTPTFVGKTEKSHTITFLLIAVGAIILSTITLIKKG